MSAGVLLGSRRVKVIVPVGLLSPDNVALSVSVPLVLNATPGPAFVLSVGIGVGFGVGAGVGVEKMAARTMPRCPVSWSCVKFLIVTN